MPEPDLLARYNYDAFVPAKFEPWLNFAGSPVMGEPAPDFPLWSLDGGVTRLSVVWASHAYNMTWIFNRSGVPVYKSDWSDHFSVANALEYFLHVGERRRAGEKLAPFRVERLDYRDHDRAAFYRGLERSGPKAVAEFRAAFG